MILVLGPWALASMGNEQLVAEVGQGESQQDFENRLLCVCGLDGDRNFARNCHPPRSARRHAAVAEQGEQRIAAMLRGGKRVPEDGDIESRKHARSDARERQSAVCL